MTAAPAEGPINVVGFVVQTAPGKAEAVRLALAGLDGVDVHADTDDGRIVATAIDLTSSLAIDQLAAINRIAGVVSTMLAYHEIDHPVDAGEDAARCGCAAASHAHPTTSCRSERA